MDREEILKRVVMNCRDFIRQLHYHRAMLPHTKNLKTNIWIYTFNNFIDMAVLNWCHLFGNWSDDLHWKNVVSNPDDFKSTLLSTLKFTDKEFKEYWETVKSYRDKDVAHIEVSPKTDVPTMDRALQSVAVYYANVIEELHKNGEYCEFGDDLIPYIKEVQGLADNYINSNMVELFEYTDET